MAHSHSLSDNPGTLVGVAVLSAAVGAITAIMIAPRSGQDMRATVLKRARDMRNKTQDANTADADKTLSDAIDSAVQAKDNLKYSLKKKFSDPE